MSIVETHGEQSKALRDPGIKIKEISPDSEIKTIICLTNKGLKSKRLRRKTKVLSIKARMGNAIATKD